MSDDCKNNNQPVSTQKDAAKNIAKQTLVRKLDCSQTYQCLTMTDQRSVEMLAIKLAGRTFVYQ